MKILNTILEMVSGLAIGSLIGWLVARYQCRGMINTTKELKKFNEEIKKQFGVTNH